MSFDGELEQPTAEVVQGQLERILQHPSFVRSKQIAKLLRFVVEQTLEGNSDDLKGYVIAVDVLGRRESFDPKLSTIVRSEARRLRDKLAEYYRGDGAQDVIEIRLPKGSYVPRFELRGAEESEVEPEKLFAAYRILAELDSGGGGTVYKAEDTRLHRTVALKILPVPPNGARNGGDEPPEALAAALDHPNICTVFETGAAGGRPYIASAFVAGENLAVKIERGRLALRTVLDIGIQISEGLVAAHSHNVIHCDLKPSNILIANDGPKMARVKIIDFGIAEKRRSTEPLDPIERFGTMAYMSPEQLNGDRFDQRTDIWSLGVALYEALTGRLPFDGENSRAVRLAILHRDLRMPDDPELKIDPGMERILRKCLAKAPGDRYSGADVLLTDLVALATSISERAKSVARSDRRTLRVPKIAQIAAGAIVAATLFISWHYWGDSRTPDESHAFSLSSDPRPLTSYPGRETGAAFSPDGSRIAYARRQPGGDFDIWIEVISQLRPIQITSDPADDLSPAWSPDGMYIAFLRRRPDQRADLVLVSSLDGRERKITTVSAELETLSAGMEHGPSWSPDGRELAINERSMRGSLGGLYAVDVDTGYKRLLVDHADLLRPAYSPDGAKIAFFSDNRLMTVDRNGGVPKFLASASGWVRSQTWTPSGREVVYSDGGRLWIVSAAGGEPRLLKGAGTGVISPAISSATGQLVFARWHPRTDIWRMDTQAPEEEPELIISSISVDANPRYSPDGTRLAFYSNRSGVGEIWVADADGSNAIPLTDMNANGSPRWSPDGSMIAFDGPSDSGIDIFVVSASGGSPQRITTHESMDQVPSFSGDGQSIYFNSTRTGQRQIWKVPIGGEVKWPGCAVQVTRGGGVSAIESVDGKFLYYVKERGTVDGEFANQIWRVPVEGGEEEPVVTGFYGGWGNWMLDGDGIFRIDRTGDARNGPRWAVFFRDFAAGATSKILPIRHIPFFGGPALDVSPDGRWVMYAAWNRTESDLMIMDGFVDSTDQ